MEALPLALILSAYLIAALLKGITGLGFSTICLPLLTFFIDPKLAIPLVIVPSLTSNALIMVQSGHFVRAARRFWPVYLSALPGLAAGVGLLSVTDPGLSRAVLGTVLVVYGLWALAVRPIVLSAAAERRLAVPAGLCTGLVNGLTGSQVMPLLPFMLSLPLDRPTFVQAINQSFTFSSLWMLVLLGGFGLLDGRLVTVSLAGVLPVAAGIAAGTKIRQHLKDAHYRHAVLVFLLAIGLSLAVKGVIGLTG